MKNRQTALLITIIFLAAFIFTLFFRFQRGAQTSNRSFAGFVGIAQAPVETENPELLLNGTPAVSYYLPLVKVEEDPLPMLTRTPTVTLTATSPVTWYGVGIYDDTHPGITTLGKWNNGDGTAAFLGTIKSSNQIGNEAIFHFEARQISIIYSADANHGIFEVWIDGVLVGELNQYSLGRITQLQWDSNALSPGKHSLVLRHIGGAVNELDGLIVSDYAYPPGPGVPPLYSTSYYMKTVDTSTLYQMGCNLGVQDWNTPGWQDSLVILDFGMPRDLGSGIYGASLFGLGPASTNQIAEAIKAVGYGYVICSLEESRSHLRIGIGTSNYGSQVTYNHGRTWAQMVNLVNNYFIGQGFYSRVDAVGANDMELDWNSVSVTRSWVNGYDSENQYPLFNFGDAGGCPSVFYPTWRCNNSWTLEDIWYISYGAPPSYPLPLIYADSGINAAQWHWIGLYAYQNHGASMYIVGEMTQWQSCLQLGGCGTLDNTPAEGWTYLWSYLNNDLRTAQDLRYSTDIMYYGY